eukprot:6102886-Pleurochrysis_carterae.AAC.5
MAPLSGLIGCRTGSVLYIYVRAELTAGPRLVLSGVACLLGDLSGGAAGRGVEHSLRERARFDRKGGDVGFESQLVEFGQSGAALADGGKLTARIVPAENGAAKCTHLQNTSKRGAEMQGRLERKVGEYGRTLKLRVGFSARNSVHTSTNGESRSMRVSMHQCADGKRHDKVDVTQGIGMKSGAGKQGEAAGRRWWFCGPQ